MSKLFATTFVTVSSSRVRVNKAPELTQDCWSIVDGRPEFGLRPEYLASVEAVRQ